MPFFTILQSGLDLGLHFLISLHPVYSLAISSVYFIGKLFPLPPYFHSTAKNTVPPHPMNNALGNPPSSTPTLTTLIHPIPTGWLVQWSIWTHCEISGIGFDNAGRGETCWQVNLDHRKNSMIPLRSSQGVVNGRVGLGAVVIALYVAYFTLALLAVMRNRRGGGKGVKIGSSEMMR